MATPNTTPDTTTAPISLHAIGLAGSVASSRHVICELARMANCGYCWVRPQQPCLTGRDGVEGYHLARFARAAHRGLISAADFDAVLGAAGDGMFNGAAIVFDDVLSARP